MYQSLYRKYRPQTFSEIYGQDGISQTLTNAIIYDRVAHAYLFSGPRGTGKTSTAKLLAKALNCTNIVDGRICDECENCLLIKNNNHPDVIEIDAASNNGVDEVRDLIEKVKYAPIKGRKKVYIIDEVHMMSQGAFNALLKTLEEPPEHVVFILATTEQHKVLATIKSRCQKFNFKKLSEKDIVACLENILKQENCQYELAALKLIASLCDGGMRDALSIAEQVMIYSSDNITVSAVNEALDLVAQDKITKLYDYLMARDLNLALDYVNELSQSSIDYQQVMSDLVKKAMTDLVALRVNNEFNEQQYLLNMIEKFDESLDKLKYDNNKKLYLDLAIIKTVNYQNNLINEETKTVSAGVAAVEDNKQSEIALPIKQEEIKEEVKTIDSNPDINERVNQESIDQNLTAPVDSSDYSIINENNNPEISATVNDEEEIIIPNDPNQLQLLVESEADFDDEKPAQILADPIETIKESSSVVNDDELLNVLVQASRDDLNLIKEKWQLLSDYLININTKQNAALLIESIPVAASNQAIIVVCQTTAEVKLINDAGKLNNMANFLIEVTGDARYCFAIIPDDWKALRNKYVQLRQVNRLPKAKSVLSGISLIEESKNEEKQEPEDNDELLSFGKQVFKDKLIIRKEDDNNEY